MSLSEPEPPITFEAFGVQVELAVGDSELESQVQEILPPGFRECDPTESTGRFGLWRNDDDAYEVTFEGAPIIEHAALPVALTMLDAEIRLFIASRAPGRVFVHAGVVACNGLAVVIPGESFSGKTTLVGALVRAGATYYSDEYAVLDEAGLVHPYPRPLSHRTTDGVEARQRVAVDGTLAPGERARLAVVAITRYRPGAEWQPKRLSRGQGVVALLANTIPAQARPEESLRTLRRATDGVTVLASDRGEAAPAAGALLEELAMIARNDLGGKGDR